MVSSGYQYLQDEYRNIVYTMQYCNGYIHYELHILHYAILQWLYTLCIIYFTLCNIAMVIYIMNYIFLNI